MTEKTQLGSGTVPPTVPQGWSNYCGWLRFFSSLFTSIGNFFCWTPATSHKIVPFPTGDKIRLTDVQKWLKDIQFETKLNLAEIEIQKGYSDPVSKQIDKLKKVKLQVQPHIHTIVNGEDWTAISNYMERVEALENTILEHKPKYLPFVQGPPESQAIRETFGLGSLGNDCFMNATLQMVFSSPFLVKHIVYGKGQNVLVKQVYEKWLDHYRKGDFSAPPLANVLRSLDKGFEGNSQCDANDFLMALIRPLEKEGNPLFFKQEEWTKYKGLQPSELKEENLFNEWGYKTKVEPMSTLQLSLEPRANYPLIDELIAADFNSCDVDQGEVEFEKTDGRAVKASIEERKMIVEPAPYLFVYLIRHQHETFGAKKNDAKVSFQRYFYIPPNQTLDGKGAKYEWVSYAVQKGSMEGGHYTVNVKHSSGTHHYSDSTKLPKNNEDFQREGEDFYLGFARRVRCDDVEKEMTRAHEQGKAIKEMGNALGNKKGEEKILALIQLFASHLDQDKPKLIELQWIYDRLDTRFKEFVATFLPKNPRHRLLELKKIDQKLGAELSGNIVAQYETVRKQNIRISRDLKKEREGAELEKTRLEFLATISDEKRRLQVAKILDPGLEKVLLTISVDELLKTNALQLELNARLKAIETARNGR